MINVRKGNAHSLAQTDFVGTTLADEAVVAGMLVVKNSSGQIVQAGTLATSADVGLIGFAVTNQSEGDAIESGKLGAYALDGSSVIETDQVTNTLSGLTGADVGKAVISGDNGQVTVVAHGDVDANRVIGTVYDVPRNIFVGFTGTLVLPILLANQNAGTLS